MNPILMHADKKAKEAKALMVFCKEAAKSMQRLCQTALKPRCKPLFAAKHLLKVLFILTNGEVITDWWISAARSAIGLSTLMMSLLMIRAI
jgi:hypothetical protein